MIRGIDITQLLTSGDQTTLRDRVQQTRRSVGNDVYRLDQINAAVTADSTTEIAKDKSARAKDVLGSTIDSVYSRNLTRDGAKPSDTVRSDDTFTQAVDNLTRFMTKNVMGQARSSLVCEGYLTPSSSAKLTCAALVGNGVVPLGCDATVVPSGNAGLTANLTMSCTVQTATFQEIDYRWGDNDGGDWEGFADPASFSTTPAIDWNTKVWLATRVRLSDTIELTGNDWELYCRLEIAVSEAYIPVDWFEVTSTSDYFQFFTPNSSTDRTGTTAIDKANAVTRPGPGNPVLHDDIVIAQASPGAQGPVIGAGQVSSSTEIEVWFPLLLSSPSNKYVLTAGSRVYFQLRPSTLATTGLNVIAGNLTTDSYWWQAQIGTPT